MDRILCDSHVHIESASPADKMVGVLKQIIDDYNYSRLIVHALPSTHRYSENYEAFYCKAQLSPKVYASVGMCHHFNCEDTPEYYLDEIKKYYAMGCDGLKILDGKPNYRKSSGRPLNDRVYDKMFAFCEENGIAVTMHIGDPARFWDVENATEVQKMLGWVYGDEYPSLEQLRLEAFGILEKFPKLKMIFAHFNFMAHELDRVAENFEKWENLRLDLTPGGEMYKGFTANYDKAKALFEKYSDRILYGTDANCNYEPDSWTHKALNIVRPFMEGKEEYIDEKIGDTPLKPFGFGGEILTKIYRDNFVRIYGENPRPLDCELIAASISGFMEKFKIEPIGAENLRLIEKYFKSKRL